MVRGGNFAGLCAAFLALGIFSSAVLVNLISLLEANGMVRQNAVFAQSVVGLATIAGRLLCGWLLDRFPFRVVVPAYCLVAAGAIAAFAGGVTGPLAFAAAAGTGLMIGAEVDLLGFAVQRIFGRANYATVFGLVFAVFHLGGAVGAIGTGVLHDSTGAFTVPLLLASAACVAAAALFARIRLPDVQVTSTPVAMRDLP